MIPFNTVEVLIEIGKSGDADDPATAAHLVSIGGYDSINREHWHAWDQITDAMPTDELVDLTKGLTLTAEHHRWGGGSVAGAIWTFRQIQRRDSAVADEVADWILPRTRNPWVPYGSQNHGARSVEEYRHAEGRRIERMTAGLTEEKQNQERAEAERLVRKSQRDRSAQDRDSDIRKNLIAELNQLTIEEQLHRLATDELYSVEFYPTSIAGAATEEVVNSLNEETRLALCMKLKGKKRGPWSKFKRRLH
jgi:hypothetical protein